MHFLLLLQSKTELVELQRLEIEASAEGTVPNVAVVLVRAEESGLADEARLLRAVEDRYEALYDKLFTGVLIKQVGQEDWDQLSSQERMAKLVDLKQQAQKLKQEGQWRGRKSHSVNFSVDAPSARSVRTRINLTQASPENGFNQKGKLC